MANTFTFFGKTDKYFKDKNIFFIGDADTFIEDCTGLLEEDESYIITVSKESATEKNTFELLSSIKKILDRCAGDDSDNRRLFEELEDFFIDNEIIE